MTTFLFWNVMKRDLSALIARAVVEHSIDILMLAESGVPDDQIQTAIESATGGTFAALSQENDKIRLFSNIPEVQWERRQTDMLSARMAIWRVAIGKPPGILLAAAHFVSKNNSSQDEQAMLAVELAKEIAAVEDGVGHDRTVVVGDLNMNPFEPGMTGAPALHAVMTRKIAARVERKVEGAHYRFFYNPMWGLFGDRTSGPPGTYYHRSATVGDLFWHMIDQVLLRPELMDLLHDLVILDRIDGELLVSQPAGLPRAATCSDHLPLTFRLQLE